MFVGRSYDQGSWIRRTTKESLSNNGRNSPAPGQGKLHFCHRYIFFTTGTLSDYKSDEKQDTNLLVPSDSVKPGASTELISQVMVPLVVEVKWTLTMFI